MITDPEWFKTEVQPYPHQISQECITYLVECLKCLRNGEIVVDTSIKMVERILTDEIDDPAFLEFAIDNFTELFSYITTGEKNIRIYRDITGEIRFYVDKKQNQDS